MIYILQFSSVQTYITKKISSYLSHELDSKITLDRVYFKPFTSLELINFTAQNKNGDTIVAVKELQSNFVLTQLLNNKIRIEGLTLIDAQVNIEIFKDSTNFTKFVKYFSAPKKATKGSGKLELALEKIELKDNCFKLYNHTKKHNGIGVDFSDLYLYKISGVFSKLKFGETMTAQIKDFTLQDKSGLYIRKLTTDASYSPTKMEFKNLYLATNRSIVTDYLKFEYQNMRDFSDFIRKVHITGTLKDSYVDSKDIEFFAPSMRAVVFETAIKTGYVKGTVSDIKAKNIHLMTGRETLLTGDIAIKGLPYIDNTIFDLDLDALQTTPRDVEILVPKFANSKSFNLPEQLHRLQQVLFKGKFKGLYNSFMVDGDFQTALGLLATKNHITIKNTLGYSGTLQTASFDVGQFINIPILGTTGMNLSFDGHGLVMKELDLKVNGSLNNSRIKGYTYNKIDLEASIFQQNLDAQGLIEDPNLRLSYNTAANWNTGSPEYLLEANIDYIQFNALNLLHKDSVTLTHGRVSTNLIGNSINNITGHLDADSLQFITSKGNFTIDNINFTADGNQENRTLYLDSDIVDAKMYGKIDLNTIDAYFMALAMRYAPAIGLTKKEYNPQNFDLTLNIKDFKPIAALFDPSFNLDAGSYLKANFSTDDYTANFIAFSPIVEYKGMRFTNLAVHERADEKDFSLDINADRLNFGDSTYINHINIRNVLANDSLHFNIVMSEKQATNYLDLKGNIHFAHNAPAYIKFSPSTIIINKEPWNLNKEALVRISKGKFYFSNLIVSQSQQQVKLDGIMSGDNDKLHVSFDRFNLNSLNGITNPLGIHLQGLLNGKMDIISLLKKPLASANIQTSTITYNDIAVGKLDLVADFDPLTGLANINLNLADDQQRGIKLDGFYNFFDENEKLNIQGSLNETDLSIFQPFLKNLVSNLSGKGNGDIAVKGTFKNPKISGLARIKNAEFTVNYLKTHYKVDNQSALVENNAIMLQNLTLRDTKGQTAVANGIINLAKLANPYIDIDIVGKNFLILNTSYKDNNLYYGTVYSSGTFKFKGFTSAIDIDISARSENNTVITIPFNSALTITDSDFIYFVDKDSTDHKTTDRKSLFKGLTMNMDITITPEAEVNLPTNLGTLKGNGQGAITMKISSLGDFEMFGDYVVSSGKFHFTAQDFINKYFDIKEGGTIRWTGDPSDAVINLNAIYQQRTAVGPLYNAAGRAGDDERVLAQADMLIKGTLEQPDITFDLNFPQNPYIKDQLQSYLSDANNVNQQALSLIVRRSFTPSSTMEIGREVNNTLLSAGTEIAFNQLNSIISQSLNINFFDLNIRSFNDASASVRLLNDRLILTGGITDRTNYQATDLTFFREGVTTDAELTYRLRKDGNLMLRAYNRPYTRNFLIRVNDAEYISALGIVYRQEFNTLREFWQKLWIWGDSKKNIPKTENK